MKQSARDSLSGQNRGRRVACVGSSPALSPSKKTRLWQRLRKYDREIAEIDEVFKYGEFFIFDKKRIPVMKKSRQELDEKRRVVRMKLKGYLITKK